MKGIQIGAGNIGRGFIGELLANSGFEVVFVDANDKLVSEINDIGEYTVHVLDSESRENKIKNIRGVNVKSDKFIEEMLDADIITTAVGVNILGRVAENLAKGIKNRLEKGVEKNLNIIACENAVGASEILKKEVMKYLTKEEIESMEGLIGFPNSSVDRIVPPVSYEMKNPLDVVVESYYEWNVDKDGFRGEIPKIQGMNLTGSLIAYVERKLFTLNTGHAITAYLGNLKGYKTIEESIKDQQIYNIVYNAMIESGNGLINKYGFDREAHINYIGKIIKRFENPYLKDDIKRVGREPLRKLSNGDRLIKPLLTAIFYGGQVDNLITGIGAVLYYNNQEDPQSVKLQTLINEKGIEASIKEITQIDDGIVLSKIVNVYNNISKNFKETVAI